MNEYQETPPLLIGVPSAAEERTKLSEARTELSVERKQLSKERIQLSEQRIDLSEQRIELAEERTDLAAQPQRIEILQTKRNDKQVIVAVRGVE